MKTIKAPALSCAMTLGLFLLPTFFFAVPSQSLAQGSANRALALSWKGHADTDLKFSEFFDKDNLEYTLALRFMPQFPHAYEGPFVAENGSGVFMIGQGDYNAPPVGTKLMLVVGSKSQVLPVALNDGQWHHLAVVVKVQNRQALFTLYLDGTRHNSTLTIAGDVTDLPSGTLRFGKRTTGQAVNRHNAQFYGFLDDIAMFKRALSPAEIQNLSSSVLQLTGNESGLFAGYTFNPGNLPPKLSRTISLRNGAQQVEVSVDRNSVADSTKMPLPTQHVEMSLPFLAGEAWQVIQGFDVPNGSHKGAVSFCWDFILAGLPAESQYPFGSDGAPFYAAAAGQVLAVKDDGPPGPASSPSNEIQIQQASEELCYYLHLKQNSAEVDVNDNTARGQELALTGDSGANLGGNHLHLGVQDKRGNTGEVTFPVAFSDYEVRDGNTWKFVSRGIPKYGEVIRSRPPYFEKKLVGDKDNFHPGDPADEQLISDEAFDIAGCFGASQVSGNVLDQGGSDRGVALSHYFFSAPLQRPVLSAHLVFRFKGNSSEVRNDFVAFQFQDECAQSNKIVMALKDLLNGKEPGAGEAYTVAVDLTRAPVRVLSSLSQIPQNNDSWPGGPSQRMDLRSELSDGQLDLVFLDCDLTLDYSELTIVFDPALPKPTDAREKAITQSPSSFALVQNHPNPFNPETRISYALAQPGVTTLRVYNMLGHEVKTIAAGRKEAGSYDVIWDGKDALGREVASGVYVYRLEVQADSGEKFTAIRKMSLMR